jgi:hypothetical protein
MVFVAIVSNGADCSHDRAGEGSSRSRSLGTPTSGRGEANCVVNAAWPVTERGKLKFRKGQSGNPDGRPKVMGDVQELARQHAPAVIVELARFHDGARMIEIKPGYFVNEAVWAKLKGK